MRTFKLSLLSVIGVLGLATISFGASNGTDDASQPAYSGNWLNGSNGEATGDAFLPWSLTAVTGTGYAGFFIGDSTNLAGGSGANINVNGNSWGMYANGDPTAISTAQRNFTADGSTISALDAGQTFSISIAVNYRNGEKGFNLLDSSGGVLFDLNIGGNAYAVNNAASGDGNLLNQTYDGDTAFELSFTQMTATSGTWTVTRTGGQTDFDSGTYTGDAAGFKLYVQDTGSTPADDFYANQLSITTAEVPEGSSAGLVACGVGALLVRKRRWPRAL